MVVLAISYCWASKAHPDPDGRILKEPCEFIKYLEASRHYKLIDGTDRGGIKNRKIVVFLDYMSLPQKSARPAPRSSTCTGSTWACWSA